MKFKYSATTEEGKTVYGELIARGLEDVEEVLAGKNLLVLDIQQENGDVKPEGIRKHFFKKKVSLKEKIMLFSNLASMLKAGLPVVDAIEVLMEGQKKQTRLKEILEMAAYDIREGETFSSTLSKFPDTFTKMDLSMFEVGETSGTLEENVKLLADKLKRQKTLQNKVKSAMMYPLVITVAMIAIGILMIVFVIPQMVGFFEDADLKLPVTTLALIWISNFLIQKGVLVVIGIVVGFSIFSYYYRTNVNFKYQVDKLILRVPFVGTQILRKMYVSSFCSTMGSLLKSGVQIVEAIEITQKGFTNAVMNKAVGEIARDVEQGQELDVALGMHPSLFYPLLVRMVKVGGKTGTIDASLFNVSEFYEEDVSVVLDNLSSIIEPVLLLVMGGAVAVLALSVISPIYQLVGGIQENV